MVKWAPGTEFYTGSGQTPGAQRVLLGGIPYHEDHGPDPKVPMTFGHYTANGQAIIAQTVENMIPEPMSIMLLGLGGLALRRRRR